MRPTAVGGGAHRGEDKSTGLGVPTHTPNPARSAGCSPRRRRLALLADESDATSAAAARGLHKDRHRPMTAENRLPCGQLEPAALWAAERTRGKDANTCCCFSQRIKWTVQQTASELTRKTDTEDDDTRWNIDANPTSRGRERTNQTRTQLAAQTCHEDRRHEMRRQNERNKKDQQSKKQKRTNRSPLPRKNKYKDVGSNQEIPRRATELHQLRPAEIVSHRLRLFALRPRANNRRRWEPSPA